MLYGLFGLFPIKLGVDVFLEGYTDIVQGKKVGLITNQTGKNGDGKSATSRLSYCWIKYRMFRSRKSVEKYISDNSEAELSHGICPECVQENFPELKGAVKKDPI